MAERVFCEQNFEIIEPSQLITKVGDMKANGARLGQICGVVKDENTYEIIYSFDIEHQLYNLKLVVPTDIELESITGIYLAAFIYENEIQDLFGVKFNHSALDYGGKFFKVVEPTPWKPKK